MQILDLKKADITRSKFYQEIITEGLQKGRQQGRQEGRQEEASSLVLRLLKRRLGQLSEVQVAQIGQLSIPQLEDLGEALLDFTDMADLERYLTKN